MVNIGGAYSLTENSFWNTALFLLHNFIGIDCTYLHGTYLWLDLIKLKYHLEFLSFVSAKNREKFEAGGTLTIPLIKTVCASLGIQSNLERKYDKV